MSINLTTNNGIYRNNQARCQQPLAPARKEKRADQPFKNVRQPTATTCCLHWTGEVGNNSFSKAYVYARCFVYCYWAHYVIKVLISWSWQRRFLRLCVHKIYTVNVKYSIIYAYKRIYIYVYAPELEAAAPHNANGLAMRLRDWMFRIAYCSAERRTVPGFSPRNYFVGLNNSAFSLTCNNRRLKEIKRSWNMSRYATISTIEPTLFLLFCTITNKCTIISQIITLLHVSPPLNILDISAI
jgi:hypothetical protein